MIQGRKSVVQSEIHAGLLGLIVLQRARIRQPVQDRSRSYVDHRRIPEGRVSTVWPNRWIVASATPAAFAVRAEGGIGTGALSLWRWTRTATSDPREPCSSRMS